MTPEPTAVPDVTPEVTPTPTPEPTATAEPTPTPVPKPGTYDLLNFYPDEDHMGGDMWSFPDGIWAGPLEEPQQGPDGATIDGNKIYAHREVASATLSDGTTGPVIRHAVDGDAGYRIGSNRYGMGDIGLEAGKSYRVTAVVNLSGTPMTDKDTLYVLGVCYGTENPLDGYVELVFDGEWHTYEIEFRYDGSAGPNICIGPHRYTGCINYDYDCQIESVTVFEIIEPEKYKNGYTADEMESMYDITEDNVIKFAAYDYRNTGSYYAISKNIYDGIQKADKEPLYGVWYEADRSNLSMTLPDGGDYDFHTWEPTIFNIKPLLGQFGNSYYLWMSNFTPFSDGDGGWSNFDVTFNWVTADGEKFSASTMVYVDYCDCQIVNLYEIDTDNTGHIYTITEGMYNSFKYTGEKFNQDGYEWQVIDRDSIGIVTVNVFKLPEEGADVESLTDFLSSMSEDCGIFAAKAGDGYYIWLRHMDQFPLKQVYTLGNRRGLLVWYDKDTNELCQQLFFTDRVYTD